MGYDKRKERINNMINERIAQLEKKYNKIENELLKSDNEPFTINKLGIKAYNTLVNIDMVQSLCL